ncbi:hypothetical protein F2Q70_00035836 [Brassica cretica]|uniref:Uncharacterized protein n=1 Tax=Brassica cretica TaxID=69181 RepID=A0A8S9JQ18_BRACR|nr:hypothetical protein F2Q68_00031061 [Brassica cretica]KAF2583712.1 hypothetical protein F2Q70_00035836 [Brassica cretica]
MLGCERRSMLGCERQSMVECEHRSIVERERRSILIFMRRLHVVSEAWLSLAASHLCIWSTSLYCSRTVVLLWHGRYGYLCVLPTRFPLPVRMKYASSGFEVTIDRWCSCVVD